MCLSGTLEDKLAAAASAGFDGIEIFEPDLVASPWSPKELAARCADLGLSIDLYQPFRDLDSTDPDRFARNLRRAERKFDVMAELGTDTVLVCSSVSPDAVDDLDRLAEQLRPRLPAAAERGLRIAYEALAWGRHVSTWDRSWEAVRRADPPALGLCLDSFHVLSRGDPAGFAEVPGEKLFFLQLADAPHLDMDVLQWSRHHRLFPGQGAFDLPGFLEACSPPAMPARCRSRCSTTSSARPTRPAPRSTRCGRCCGWRRASRVRRPDLGLAAPPAAPALSGYAFTELAVDGVSGPQVAGALGALGFTHTGQHRSKPVQLWEQGGARVLLNASVVRPAETGTAEVAALALESSDPGRSARRARVAPGAGPPPDPRRHRGRPVRRRRSRRHPGVLRPHRPGRLAGRLPAHRVARRRRGGRHGRRPRLAHPAVRRLRRGRAVLPVGPRDGAGGRPEVAAPFGIVRSRAVTDPDRDVRLALTARCSDAGSGRPACRPRSTIAFATDDAVATARALRAAGAPLLPVPANYHDDLESRVDLDPGLLADLRECGLFYDEDAHGRYLHLATVVLGSRVFFEVVQRLDGYDGYGTANAPVRMAAHRRLRARHPA